MEEFEQIVKQSCLQTGLIGFMKKCSESAVLVSRDQNMDPESMLICYYLKLEVIWIITNIVAAVHSDTDPDILNSLLFENGRDLTQRSPSLVFELIGSMLGPGSTSEYRE